MFLVDKIKKLFGRDKNSKFSIEVGSETGLEEEFNRPTQLLDAQKKGKSTTVFGIKVTFKF